MAIRLTLVAATSTTVWADLPHVEAEFPVIIRLAERLFESPEPEVVEQTDVDTCVLGIRNVGTAHVTGQLQPDFVRSEQEAALQLVFQGETIAWTTGKKGPATITSATTCRFQLRTPIVFDEAKGFAAGEAQAEIRVAGTSHWVRTSAPGLRGRLVKRVAHNRIREKSGQILAITEESTRSRITESMDRRVKDRIDTWNEHWLPLRAALRSQAWYPEAPKFSFATSDDQLLVFVATDKAEVGKPADQGLIPENLPVAHHNTIAEILILNDWLRAQLDTDAVVTYLTVLSEPLLVVVAEPATVRVDTAQQQGWSIVRIQRQAAP